jgi:hypothetical protein
VRDARRLAVSDLDITRAAHLLIQQRGDEATARARRKVEEMRRLGDTDGADTWLRIIVAIGTLGAPPTGARHWTQLAQPTCATPRKFVGLSSLCVAMNVFLRACGRVTTGAQSSAGTRNQQNGQHRSGNYATHGRLHFRHRPLSTRSGTLRFQPDLRNEIAL